MEPFSENDAPEAPLGANYLGGGECGFLVWAPRAAAVDVHLVGPPERFVPLRSRSEGYYSALVDSVSPGARYFYRLDGDKDRPDPASHFQPEGVHGPSEVVGGRFDWHDAAWCGLLLRDYIIYELHVGTFTAAGTLDAAGGRLGELRDLGVTAVELMPVAQFPGPRNWGYDGVYPFAVQNSYGGPSSLKRFVDACHSVGMAVILDVVYNHLGPEGNYLADFGPYFTGRYHTPWGAAVNLDGPESDGVRRFFIENAVRWAAEFHFDALRLDAVHAIVDLSAFPFLEELGESIHGLAEGLNRAVYVIAESDLGDSRVVKVRELGGYGLDAQWNDDFHHALHAVLTEESNGYYQDFGAVSQLAEAFRAGYVYQGQYSKFRRRRHGNSTQDLSDQQFVVFAQNHDQVGNRLPGDRLPQLVSGEQLKVAASAVLLSPFIPLLFMGEEYGETAPFQFFVSYSDRDVIEATRRGRQAEFAGFRWQGDVPDPQDESTFLSSKVNSATAARNCNLLEYYRELIRLRKTCPALSHLSKKDLEARSWDTERVLVIRRWDGPSQAALILSFGPEVVSVAFPLPPGLWRKALDSKDTKWGGPGSSVPWQIESGGDVTITVPPCVALLFLRSPAEG
ncbi:MAG: malto-oligosyltrehalose trehalohydrolase [Terriglobia bacterium]